MGDSITNGKMRMEDLDGYFHPELAYPRLVKERFENEFGGTFYEFIKAKNGGNTGEGTQFIDEVCEIYPDVCYLLVMMGTNDAWDWLKISTNTTLENLNYILDKALSCGKRPVISTVPPRNDQYNIAVIRDRITTINAGIIEMAQFKGVKYIDTHTNFMQYNPPNGWKELLEDFGNPPTPGLGGQHPSPKGHEMIAVHFAGQALAYPPDAPINIKIISSNTSRCMIQWDPSPEFDCNQYGVAFGYFSGDLDRKSITSDPHHIFIYSPIHSTFLDKIYFKIQGVDTNGNGGSYSDLFNTQSVTQTSGARQSNPHINYHIK